MSSNPAGRKKSLFDYLGMGFTRDFTAVKREYRRQQKLNHPDKSGELPFPDLQFATMIWSEQCGKGNKADVLRYCDRLEGKIAAKPRATATSTAGGGGSPAYANAQSHGGGRTGDLSLREQYEHAKCEYVGSG